MTLDLSATRKDFLFANSTNSPDLFPQVAGDYTVAFWFYHAGNPASDQTIFHYANDSDSSGSRLLTRSNGTLQSQMTTSGGATTIKSSATLTVGWHQFLMWHLLGTGTRYYLDTVQFGAHATGEFDASLTKMQLGRPFVSATPLDMQIAGFAVADAYADSTKRTTLYSGGTDPSRDANVSLPSFFKASIPMENSLVPTLGDAELGIGIAPTFADDSALFVTDGYTASRIDAVPTMRNGENIPSNGNADLILLGDSYVGFHQPIRVGSHIVNELLTATNAPLRKLQHGVTPWDESLTIATATENAKTGGEYHRISDNGSADKYKVGRDTATSRNMAVPCNHMVEHWTGSDSAGTDYASMTFQNARSPETGPLSSWLDSGTKLKVHPLIWKHEVDAIDDLRYVDNGTNTIDATLSGLAAGKFHKLPAITLDDNSTDKERTIQLRPTGPWPANKLLNWAGVNVQIEGVDEGLGIAVAADNSWSYGGFGGDQSATSPTNKNFSIGEIEPWLGAFLEGGRQAIYVLSLAGESIGEYLVKLRTEAIISQYETIHANLGMLPPRFLLLSHYVAATFAQASPYRHRFDAEDAALAFDEIAQAQSHVAHFSYYKATGGAYLHDEANANLGPNDADGPQEQWLLDYDATNSTTYATAPGRSGLDTADVHPRNRDAAVMFSQLAVKSVAANFGEGISSSAIPWQPSRSMHFNGTGHVDCGVLNLPAADQTILMNVANVVGSGYLFSSRNNRSGGLSIYRNGISVQPYIGTSGNTNVSVPQDSFVLAVVYKHAAGAISTYIDGVLVFTDTSLVGTWAIGAKTFIGARNTTLGSASFQINADIKDVRVLARAASAQEIADHYADPIKHLLDTFRHYKGESVLDVANGVDTVYDSSGNGNHSTAVGGVSTVETAPYSFAKEVGYSTWQEIILGSTTGGDGAYSSSFKAGAFILRVFESGSPTTNNYIGMTDEASDRTSNIWQAARDCGFLIRAATASVICYKEGVSVNSQTISHGPGDLFEIERTEAGLLVWRHNGTVLYSEPGDTKSRRYVANITGSPSPFITQVSSLGEVDTTPLNAVGNATLSDLQIVPRDESDTTKDVLGGLLQFSAAHFDHTGHYYRLLAG